MIVNNVRTQASPTVIDLSTTVPIPSVILHRMSTDLLVPLDHRTRKSTSNLPVRGDTKVNVPSEEGCKVYFYDSQSLHFIQQARLGPDLGSRQTEVSKFTYTSLNPGTVPRRQTPLCKDPKKSVSPVDVLRTHPSQWDLRLPSETSHPL